MQLRDELVTLLVAGHETTASQLAWTSSGVAHPGGAGAAPARAARGRRLPRVRDQGVPAHASRADLLGAAHRDGAGRGRSVHRAGRLDHGGLRLAGPAPPGPLSGAAGVRPERFEEGPRRPSHGSRSAAACVAAWAPPSPATRCGSCCARSSSAASSRRPTRSPRRCAAARSRSCRRRGARAAASAGDGVGTPVECCCRPHRLRA